MGQATNITVKCLTLNLAMLCLYIYTLPLSLASFLGNPSQIAMEKGFQKWKNKHVVVLLQIHHSILENDVLLLGYKKDEKAGIA